MFDPRSSYVEADNVRLHYFEWDPDSLRKNVATDSDESLTLAEENTDNIPLVLLHGLSATADSWRLVAQYLLPDHPLFAVDLRGHGLSDAPAEDYALATIAEDVISGMAKLGLGQVAVVGHGWGARVAMAMAARHPALVSHLVLVDCPLVEPRHWPGMTRERFIAERESAAHYPSRERYLNILHRVMAPFWSPDVERIVLSYVTEAADGTIHEKLSEEHQCLIRASLWDDNALSYYARLSCPVLLIPAAAEPQPDDELPERLEDATDFAAAKGRMAAQVARAIQRCTVLWMADSVHDLQLQRPREIAEAIVQFLQD